MDLAYHHFFPYNHFIVQIYTKWYERTISLSAQINMSHCKIPKQQDKGGYGGVILKWGSTHKCQNTGFGRIKLFS